MNLGNAHFDMWAVGICIAVTAVIVIGVAVAVLVWHDRTVKEEEEGPDPAQASRIHARLAQIRGRRNSSGDGGVRDSYKSA